MTMVRLLHLADLHPNNTATFAGQLMINPETGWNQALDDLRKSLQFVYETATAPETQCALALIAGDLFDSPRPHPNEIRVIRDFLYRLADAMPVVIIAGNHDISQNPLDATALECVKGGSALYIFERPGSVLLHCRDGQQVRVHALPYPTKGRLLASDIHKDRSPEEIMALMNQGLAAILRGFVAEQDASSYDILVAHGTVATAKVGEQPRPIQHDILLPVDLFDRFHYVALGHIHQPQQVTPNAWYSGSLMRNGFGEEMERKGFNMIELDRGTDPSVTFIENPYARRYRTVSLSDLLSGVEPSTEPGCVWRLKDRLLPTEYDDAAKAAIQRAQAHAPFFQVAIEITTEARARDAEMSKVLTTEEALMRALTGKLAEDELPIILEKHRMLEQQLGE